MEKISMKICLVTALINHGGVSVVAFEIAKGMAQKGHKVLIICSGESHYSFKKDGYQVLILKNNAKNAVYHYLNPFLLLKLRKQLNNFNPDIIHVHNINLQTFSLSTLLFSKYFPMVWTLHDVWCLCITGWPLIPDCYGLPRKCFKCPIWPNWMVKLNRILKEAIYSFSKPHIICPSYWLKSLLKYSVLGQANYSTVIYNGIDSKLFYKMKSLSMRSTFNIEKDKIVILFCGGKRIAKQYPAYRKGWNHLYIALQNLGKKYTNLHLLYVGDPIQIPTKSTFSFTFATNVSRKEMNVYYNISDFTVLPTLADNFALTILEAMASKLPIIASNTGGIPEALIDHQTGLLCPPRNPIILADKIELLILHPEFRSILAENAYFKFKEKFSFNDMIDKYEIAYKKTIYANKTKKRNS